MKAYRGRRSTAPLFLNLGARWRSMVNIMPHPLCPREKILYLLNRGLVESQGRTNYDIHTYRVVQFAYSQTHNSASKGSGV